MALELKIYMIDHKCPLLILTQLRLLFTSTRPALAFSWFIPVWAANLIAAKFLCRSPRKKCKAGLAPTLSPTLMVTVFSSHALKISSAVCPCTTRSKWPWINKNISSLQITFLNVLAENTHLQMSIKACWSEWHNYHFSGHQFNFYQPYLKGMFNGWHHVAKNLSFCNFRLLKECKIIPPQVDLNRNKSIYFQNQPVSICQM